METETLVSDSFLEMTAIIRNHGHDQMVMRTLSASAIMMRDSSGNDVTVIETEPITYHFYSPATCHLMGKSFYTDIYVNLDSLPVESIIYVFKCQWKMQK